MSKNISEIIYNNNFKIKFKNNNFNVLINEDYFSDNELLELIKAVEAATNTKISDLHLYPEKISASLLGFVRDEKDNIVVKDILINNIKYEDNKCLLTLYNLDKDTPHLAIGINQIKVELSWHNQPINKQQYDFIVETYQKLKDINLNFSLILIDKIGKAVFPVKNINNFDNQKLINNAIFKMLESYKRFLASNDKNKLNKLAEIEKVKDVITIVLEEATNNKEAINKTEAESFVFVNLIENLTNKVYEKNNTHNFNKIEKMINSL